MWCFRWPDHERQLPAALWLSCQGVESPPRASAFYRASRARLCGAMIGVRGVRGGKWRCRPLLGSERAAARAMDAARSLGRRGRTDERQETRSGRLPSPRSLNHSRALTASTHLHSSPSPSLHSVRTPPCLRRILSHESRRCGRPMWVPLPVCCVRATSRERLPSP